MGNRHRTKELQHFEVIDIIGPLVEKLAKKDDSCKVEGVWVRSAYKGNGCSCFLVYAQRTSRV